MGYAIKFFKNRNDKAKPVLRKESLRVVNGRQKKPRTLGKILGEDQ